jgi:hypothetical protein
MTADAHRRQRVSSSPRIVVDTGAGDAEQAGHVLGREQRLSERQRRELMIGHDRERTGAARRNSGADWHDEVGQRLPEAVRGRRDPSDRSERRPAEPENGERVAARGNR